MICILLFSEPLEKIILIFYDSVSLMKVFCNIVDNDVVVI